MKTIQVKTLELNKTTLVELADQTILQINAGSNYGQDVEQPSQRPTTKISYNAPN